MCVTAMNPVTHCSVAGDRMGCVTG